MISRIMSLSVLIILVTVLIVTESEFSDSRDAEINQLLTKLNKPALKTIKSPDGDIIDCVHMRNHPIYDHRLFKNHTIQMRPSSYPKGWNNKSSYIKKQNMMTQLWTINGKCPKNSIPIRRTRRKDILRAESIERYGRKYPNNIYQPKPTNLTHIKAKHEYAILEVKVKSPQATFRGTKADINVWKPYVQTPREFSLAQIWVSAGSYSNQLNTIEYGWQVYQKLYGDNNPRHFIYWTVDGYKKTGCYNLNCPGFVALNREFVLGAAVSRVSTFDGDQEEIPTTIWKDPRTENWWLAINTHIIVGYWPSSLFNRLQNGATKIQWGGEIVNLQKRSQHTSTRMGSGHFAEEGKLRASYFRNLEIIDESNTPKPPVNYVSYVTEASCYNVKSGIHPLAGVYLYYGGPGRNPNCN